MIRSFNSEETGHLKENVCVKDVGEHSGIIIGVSEAIHVFGCFCLRRPEKKNTVRSTVDVFSQRL